MQTNGSLSPGVTLQIAEIYKAPCESLLKPAAAFTIGRTTSAQRCGGVERGYVEQVASMNLGFLRSLRQT